MRPIVVQSGSWRSQDSQTETLKLAVLDLNDETSEDARTD